MNKLYSWSNEGMTSASFGAIANGINSAVTEIKGWLQNVEEKKETIIEKVDKLIEWLEYQNKLNKGLDLDTHEWKKYILKVSSIYNYRYYLLMHDIIYRKILKDIENNSITRLEMLYNIDVFSRSDLIKEIGNSRSIDDLIEFANIYKERAITVFNKLSKRKTKIILAPYQAILLGANDLTSILKQLVNLSK